MSDRPQEPRNDLEVDVDLERRVRTAFRGAAVPGAPTAVHAEVARFAAAPDIRTRGGLAGWQSHGWLAVALVVSVLVVGSLLSGGSSPSPTVPSAPPGPSASTDPNPPAPTSSPTAACDVSPGIVHGAWWREIGGPNAFFHWEEAPVPAGSAPWKVFVRFDPDGSSTDDLVVWAEPLGSDVRFIGTFNSRVDPSTIFRFEQPAPDLPGGLYLFEQHLPTTGCWRMSAAVDGRLVGTAVVAVTAEVIQATPTPGGPTPAAEPTPTPELTPWPEESMAPSADDMLPLAGRNGQGGRLFCNNRLFGFDGLTAPSGAEDRVGPEYDLLRSLIGTGVDVSWAPPGEQPTFREAARDTTGVVFLNDRFGPTPMEGGPYAYITLELGPAGWTFEGSGDCQPRGVPGPDFGQAIWTLDPNFPAPTAMTRTLHLLVQELDCSGGQSASGRISPAFVIESPGEVAIELFVRRLPGEGDCPAAPPTPATLRLPTPLGDRTLLDVGAIGLGGSGG